MLKQLVIQLARFGDLLQTKRLMLTLKAKGQVHICVDRSLSALAALVYPEAVVHSLAIHGALSAEDISRNRIVFESLAGERFDQVYNLNYSGFNMALARIFDPQTISGHAMLGAQAMRSAWVRLLFRLTRHRRLAPLNLVDYWAYFAQNPVSPDLVNPEARAGGGGIGLVLAGRAMRRSLPPQVLAQNARLFFEILGGPPVFIFGSADQQPLARRLIREFPANMLEKTQNLAGKTDLPGLAGALQGLDVLLSPDTGVMHLAAHLGVPVFAFFLSSAWCFETGPYGLGHHVAQARVACLPCLESAPCPHGENLPCLAPFADPRLQAEIGSLLAPAKFPGFVPRQMQDMMILSSAFDELGGCWLAARGEDPQADERKALRELIAEYAGAALCQSSSPDLVARIYQEADWMLPDLI